MRRFVITGAPGAGKTAIIRQLELEGFSVVEEAATDVIAAAHARGTVEPWTHPSFIDAIAGLQRDRQTRASYQPDEVQFHDRCAVCTAALAVYLGHPCSPFLAGELERVKKDAIYELYRNQEGLDPKTRDEALKYYDEFYQTINDPRAVNREFIRSCRQAAAP